METIITILHIVVSVLLIVVILLQQQGVGLGAGFGGDSGSFRTKRGLEKGLFHVTIVLSVLFLGIGLASIILAA